ncbi:MAG: ATP-binding protein [Syntrophomonas sp.]
MHEVKINRRIMIMLFGISVIAAVLAGIFFSARQDNTTIQPINGILDLQGWDAERDGTITLRGQWEFHRQEFVAYGQDAVPGTIVKVPSAWNDYEKGRGGLGFGTYILRIKNAPVGVPLALRIHNFATAYELYINDRLYSSSGRISTAKENYVPWLKSDTVEFTPEMKEFTIIIHGANFAYARGGMRYAPNMGTPEQIRAMDKTIADKDLFLFGALMVMAFYYFLIFLLRPDDKSSLYFVLMCLIFACRITVLGDYLIYRLVPSISYHAVVVLDFLTTVWFSTSAVFMVKKLFPSVLSLKALWVFFSYSVLMSAIVCFSPVVFFTGLIVPVQIMAIATGVYGIGCLAAAFVCGENEAGLILMGGVALAVAALHDSLYNDSVISSGTGEWVALAQLLLILLQAFILARRSSIAFQTVNTLSQELLKLDQIKDEFLANTSHELRTPLNGILGITEAMLRGSAGELNSWQRQELGYVAGSSRRLANLVNDILDYSKMKNGDMLLNIMPVHLEGLIDNVANVFKQICHAKGLEIVADYPADLTPALADENRVVQILYNLVGNAVKFTVKGHIRISAQKTGNMLEVCVSDTGEGIPADRLEDIFKSFEQVDTSLTRAHGGTGLGLSITRQLVELQGGAIRVESRPGSGSSFSFTLPATSEEDIKNAAVPKLTYLPELAATIETSGLINQDGSPAVLIVDDDAMSLHALAAVLKTDGYAIFTAGSGRAALEAMKEPNKFSLVILDVMMPEMSGYEVCRRLRENQSVFDLPVLMLTAKTSTRDIVMGFAAGANDYLPKPFEPEELLARVRTLTMLKASVDRAMAAELSFLQAQIKPHFLFNTLSTIASFTNTNPPYARKLITGLANYLRQTFDFKNLDTFVPLERELELVKSYVEIEQARFGEKIKVEFDIDSDLNTEVFLLCIQPLVENAIRHGLRKKAGPGTVTISVSETPGNVRIMVADDGCGMGADKLETILSPEEGQGIGLWNIDRRLRKLFGKGLTIESEPGKGTIVMFTIPSGRDAH